MYTLTLQRPLTYTYNDKQFKYGEPLESRNDEHAVLSLLTYLDKNGEENPLFLVEGTPDPDEQPEEDEDSQSVSLDPVEIPRTEETISSAGVIAAGAHRFYIKNTGATDITVGARVLAPEESHSEAVDYPNTLPEIAIGSVNEGAVEAHLISYRSTALPIEQVFPTIELDGRDPVVYVGGLARLTTWNNPVVSGTGFGWEVGSIRGSNDLLRENPSVAGTSQIIITDDVRDSILTLNKAGNTDNITFFVNGFTSDNNYAQTLSGDIHTGIDLSQLSTNSAFITIDMDSITVPPSLDVTGWELYLDTGKYIEDGYTATDPNDGDITGDVIVTGTVDETVAATYPLIYTVTNSQGNEGTAQRDVVVEDQPLTF